MKLLTLNLKAVGPFTGVVLDFSRGSEGLHLVYGRNEAGKTSSLRAVSHLFFGFPARSADNFVHANDQLRVAGMLRHSQGDELEIVRRKGNRNTVRGVDDSSVVADSSLDRFLGGMNRATFETLFGIDHERLTQAGKELSAGKGELGEILFAAGAGLAGLSRVQAALQKKLDGLFLARGKNQQINRALSEINESKDILKKSQLSSEDWQKHDRAHQDALTSAEQIQEQMRDARARLATSKRIKSARPLVARRRQLEAELSAFADVIRLRDEFGNDFRDTQQKLRLAESAIDRSRKTLEDIDVRLGQLKPCPSLIDAATEIGALQERLGAIEKASADRGRLENFQQEAEHQARHLLRELARSTDLDEAETLRLRADEPTAIRALGQRFAELRGQADNTRKTIRRHEDDIRRLEKQLADSIVARDVEPLGTAVAQARKVGDLDQRLSEMHKQLALADKKAKTALARLGGWKRSAEELTLLVVPLAATVDQLEKRLQEQATQERSLAERMTREDDAIRQLETRLQSLELERDVPTEATLLTARRRRDEGWGLVKAAWLDRAPAGVDQAAFITEFDSQGSLASAYEKSVAGSDVLGDRLRREAERVAQKAEALAQLNQHRAAHTAFLDESRALKDRGAHIDREWNAVVSSLALETEITTPAELRAWLRQRDDAVQLLEKAAEIRQSLEPLEQNFATRCTAIRQRLEAFGEPLAVAKTGLAEILEHAEAIIKRHDDLLKQRATLETKLTTALSERATAELALKTAEAELADWQDKWTLMMTRIGLEPHATPEQAEVFLSKIHDLMEKLNDRRNHQSRIRGIDRDAQAFTRDVQSLVARIDSDQADLSPNEHVRALAQRLRDAQADAKQFTALTQQCERESEALRQSEIQLEQARVRLEGLCNEAKCNEPRELDEAERRSQHLARLEAERAQCDVQLIAAAAGTELTAFCQQVETTDASTVDFTIEEVEATINSQEAKLNDLNQTIGAERTELARMDGSDRAAQAAEEVQTLLARLHGDVTRYTTLKLAAAVMHRGIERYRDKNQGPILARASELFSGLTSASFARLQIDDDGDGKSVLKGVRADGRLVGVDAMSDGSHDQLYLALRLASLEAWLQSHEPVPFIVDDILLNFDDVRATAALAALAELSRRTQVLFFTHHRHIVELACAHLPSDLVFVHELAGP